MQANLPHPQFLYHGPDSGTFKMQRWSTSSSEASESKSHGEFEEDNACCDAVNTRRMWRNIFWITSYDFRNFRHFLAHYLLQKLESDTLSRLRKPIITVCRAAFSAPVLLVTLTSSVYQRLSPVTQDAHCQLAEFCAHASLSLCA